MRVLGEASGIEQNSTRSRPRSKGVVLFASILFASILIALIQWRHEMRCVTCDNAGGEVKTRTMIVHLVFHSARQD
jgi:hypothetical protein